ncbi:MAG: amino acid adenylation domain-containing protein, partial [Chloroflexales bacterium]|nr:amino acid adenylation domain-containing protein [Chloroflexales bacterium]
MTSSTNKRNIEAIYPLSPMQQGMLFHSLYAPESGVYIEQMSCVLRGDLDVALFERAWQRVIERYSTLRTAFAWKSTEQMLQVVQRQVALPLVYEDWRTMSVPEQQAQLAARLAAERAQGFDLSRAPLIRLILLRIADDAFHFVWTHHHILLDGWSLPLILKDVFAAYEAFRQNQEPRLAPVRPYRDYIAWLQRQDLAAAERFWRRTLAGFSAPTSLGAKRNSAPAEAHGYAEQQTSLSLETTAALQSFVRQQQCTLSTLVQGAWALLLSRYSGEEDVVFGATVSGRPPELPGFEQMVGLFINTLPIRVQVPSEPMIGDWLRSLQAQQVELRQYEYSPLVQVQEWSAAPPGQSLFESILVFENYPVDSSLREQSSSLRAEQVRFVEQTNYPLTVISGPGERLALRISYDRRHFDDATVERMLGHLRTILERFATDPQQRLADVSLLTEAERRQLAVWNNTAAPVPANRCIHDLFEAQVARTPDAIAVSCAGTSLTYRDLNARANQVAHHLRSLGVGPEQVVGICVDRSLEMLVGLLGILKAGGAYLPLDPDYPAERIAFMLQDAQPITLLTLERFHVRTLTRWPVRDDQDTTVPPFHLSTVPPVLLDADWPTIARQPATNPASGATPDNLAYVIYTSGSTGQPKGVLLEHRNAVAFLSWAQTVFTPDDCAGVLAATSICFDLSVFELFAPLSMGGTVILAANALALPIIPATPPVTLVNTVPSAMTELVRLGGIPETVRVVNLAGEPLPLALVQQLYQQPTIRQVYNLYGPSEDTTYSTYTLVPREASQVTIGRPIANTQVYLLDRQRQPVPIGIAGEIYLGGAGVARGYHRRPELTVERFVAAPAGAMSQRLYKTGDLGRYRPDGSIEFLGRIDQQVKLRGFRIELGEIEAVLRQHAAVWDAVVMVREDTPDEKRLVAYIVTSDEFRAMEGAEPAAPLFRRWVQQKLPDYMVPVAFVLLAALPLTPNGKVDRKALPAPEGARPDLADGYVAPRTPEEEVLSSLWAQVLNVAQPGIHDNFFELGGHSLIATRLATRIRDAFQVELPLRALFEAPSIATQAVLIATARREQAGVAASAIPPVPRDETLPLSFAQQRLWFLDQLEANSPLYNNTSALRLAGTLDRVALERSLNEIVRRHEALRTTFANESGRPVQVIHPELALDLPLIDLRHLPRAECEAEALRLANEAAHLPFDLARGPLLRVTLLRLADEEHIALLTVHHIISDGWSVGVFIREIAALYAAFVAGRPSPLPDLPVQYADFAAWQRSWLAGGADDNGASPLQRQLDYWKQQLTGSSGVLTLPTDRPRPALQSFRGAHHYFHLPRELSEALATLSRAEGATLFMTLLAAFQVVLTR